MKHGDLPIKNGGPEATSNSHGFTRLSAMDPEVMRATKGSMGFEDESLPAAGSLLGKNSSPEELMDHLWIIYDLWMTWVQKSTQ